MIYFIPILGALTLAIITIWEKFVLRKKNIDIKIFQTSAFLSAVLVMIPLLFFFWKFDVNALEPKNLLIFGGVILSSLLANYFMFFALKWEKVSNLEPALILEPLFTILLAVLFSLFFTGLYERNLEIIIPAIIASLALVFSHIKKHHLNFNKYFLAAIAGSFFFALELIISRLILEFYSPLSFYFLRCLFIFIISLIIFRPNFSKLNTKISSQIFFIGALWVLYRIVVYWGYLQLGVVFTTLMILLGPVFVYALASIFLKEKLELRNILAAIVILACILYVSLN